MQEVTLSCGPKIKLIREGKEYLLRKPKIKECLVLEAAVKSDDPEQTTNAMITFIADCGLPKEIVEDLDLEELEEVRAVLMPKKKA
jgi:hypothetical protein